MNRTHRLAAAAAALLAIALAPAAAQADSIAYVKDGDVWLSTSDGARQYRVTATGGYSDVSQADDGTMIALHGIRLRRLDRAGNVTADFATPVSDTRPPGQGKAFYGPFDPAISPGGDKVAYTYYYVANGTSPTCYPPTCFTFSYEGGTGYTRSEQLTEWADPALKRHSGWLHPSWIDNDTTMMSNPTHIPNRDVILDTVGDTGVPLKDWFTDNGTKHIGAGEMTRQRSKLAFVGGEGDGELRIYRVGTFPTVFPPPDGSAQLPEACYRYTSSGSGAFASPSWSPDGSRLVWAQAEGVHVATVPDFGAGCTTDGASQTGALIVSGAKEPDWGPADVPAGAGATPAGQAPAGGAPTPGAAPAAGARPAAGSGAADAAASGLSVRIVPASLRMALRRGLTVRVQVPGAGRVSVAATRGGRRLAAASAKASAARTISMRLRLSAAARRSLARAGRATIKVQVAFKPAQGASQRVAATATLR